MSKEEQVLKVFQEVLDKVQNRKEYMNHSEWYALLSKLDGIGVQLADDFFSADMDIETNKKFFATEVVEYDGSRKRLVGRVEGYYSTTGKGTGFVDFKYIPYCMWI